MLPFTDVYIYTCNMQLWVNSTCTSLGEELLNHGTETGIGLEGSGESTCLDPTNVGWVRFQTQCHTYVKFVGSLFCSERFSVFPSPQKPTFNLI